MIRIADKKIGKGHPVFVIAEAGVNHNGNIEIAKKIIDKAVLAGADAVKFQTFRTEDIVIKELPIAGYQRKNIGMCDSQFNVLKKVELTENQHSILKQYCDQKNIIFLSSCHSDRWSVDILDNLGVAAFKIPSPDLTNVPLLKYVSRKGKPLIISTGMATLEEIREAIDNIKENTNEIVILQCTADYPCPLKDTNLRVMKTLKSEFDLPVGFSDHTSGIEAAVIAASLGAVIIEKHFTLDKNMEGLDHKCSLEPEELREMIAKIRRVNTILGSPDKKPTFLELKNMRVLRKSIVASQRISKGTIVTHEMLAIKRPGTGLKPKYLDKIVGRKAMVEIKKDELITMKMLGG